MAILVKSEFIRKGTVRIIVYVYDDDEALVDATTVDISIVDPNGDIAVNASAVSVSEKVMTKTSTGVYEYYYTTLTTIAEGDYQIECDITDGSYHTYVHSHFSISAGINE